MWKLSQVLCCGYLCALSILDIRSRKLPIWMLLFGLTAVFVYQIIVGEVPAALSLSGAVVGIVFLIVSRITGEAFGYGDSILILILGIYLGLWNLLCLLMAAFSMAAGFSVVMLAIRHFRRKTVVPFVPFLCAGYLVTLLTGGF